MFGSNSIVRLLKGDTNTRYNIEPFVDIRSSSIEQSVDLSDEERTKRKSGAGASAGAGAGAGAHLDNGRCYHEISLITPTLADPLSMHTSCLIHVSIFRQL